MAADATFTSAPDIALAPTAMPREPAIGDFNSDGRQDLAIADASRDRVYSRLGDGTLRDGGGVVGLGAPADVVVADLDADGNEDLAVAACSARGQAVSVLRGLGDGGFTLGTGFRLPGGRFVAGECVEGAQPGCPSDPSFQDQVERSLLREAPVGA